MADTTLKLILLGVDKSASKALKGVGDEAHKSGGRIKAGMTAGLLVAGAAAVTFGKQSVDAFRDADKSQRELEDAYGRFPGLADVSIDKMRELNQAIQDKTGADADDIASSQAVLARYKLTGSQISELTPLMVDYAKRTGKDLPEAGKVLGKALGGNAKAMKELGIKFKDTGDTGKNFDQVVGGLKDTVGGFAEKEAGTLDGKLGILKTKFGDVQESVGEKLVPALTKLIDVAVKVVDWMGKNSDILIPLAAGLGIVAVAFAAVNAVMALNPFVLVAAAVGLLVAGLIYAYRESETFRKTVDTAFKAIGAAGKWLWNEALQPALKWIVEGFAWVTDGLADMLGALGKVPGFGWAKDAADDLRGVAEKARDAAEGIKDIPDADPKIEARDEATKVLGGIKSEIKTLKGKIVEAKAKGDTKGVRDLEAKMKALRNKEVTINAMLRASGSASWRISGGAGTGSLRAIAQANGGILRSYAGGGFEDHTAMIGNGVTRVWNEPETGGESYIPLAPAKRARSLGIWRETGRRLGVALADGGIAGGSAGAPAVTVMASVARGVDPLQFAREVEQELTKLARTRGGRLAFA